MVPSALVVAKHGDGTGGVCWQN